MDATNGIAQPTKPRKLSIKQRIFVDEYLKKKNATKAAMKAYDTKNEATARAIGSENLSKPIIANRIDRLLQ